MVSRPQEPINLPLKPKHTVHTVSRRGHWRTPYAITVRGKRYGIEKAGRGRGTDQSSARPRVARTTSSGGGGGYTQGAPPWAAPARVETEVRACFG